MKTMACSWRSLRKMRLGKQFEIMRVQKSSRPDGFNFLFVKEFWEMMKLNIMIFLKEFHRHGVLPSGTNSSFTALIAKGKNPQNSEQYRSISLIGCLYKILAKLLANRMRKVFDNVIDQNQSAFIGRR